MVAVLFRKYVLNFATFEVLTAVLLKIRVFFDVILVVLCRGEFRPRQTRQLPRAVDLNGAASKLSKLLITTTPFHSLTERYSVNVDGNFN